jgi:RNA polymerase sigma factor (sigma-70 family)
MTFTETTPPPDFSDMYRKLREIARNLLRWERGGQNPQSASLVNDVLIELNVLPRGANEKLSDDRELLKVAYKAMQRKLIDRARWAQRLKHGGGLERVDLDEAGADDADDAEQLALRHELRARAPYLSGKFTDLRTVIENLDSEEKIDFVLVVYDYLDELSTAPGVSHGQKIADAMRLYYLAGLSQEEIATWLGVSKEKAQSYLKFGLRWLSLKLGKAS